MHPELSAFPSNFFYDGSLQNGVSAEQRRWVNQRLDEFIMERKSL